MERDGLGFGVGSGRTQGRTPGSPVAPGSPVPAARQWSRASCWDSPGRSCDERRGKDKGSPSASPKSRAQPYNTGETLARGWFPPSDTSKGRAAPAPLLVALEKQFFPLNVSPTPQQIHQHQSRGEEKPAGLPPVSGTGGSASTALQVQPPPYPSVNPTAFTAPGHLLYP